MSKKLLALITSIMTLVVLCGAPAVAFASGNNVIKKEETVYVVTDSNGAQNDVIVSDHLYNEKQVKSISDETTLSDIENVKGDETFKQNGDKLEWAAKGNDIYYQGKTDAEVPVEMSVTYTLDGQSITGPELQGKSGDVSINISYTNNGKYEGKTVPFIVLTGLIVNDTSFTNIKVDHGKIVDDGDKQVVVGMAAPGLAQTLDVAEADLGFGDSVKITGKANKFNVEDMMTIATNSVFEDVDADLDLDFDDQIKQLDNGAKKLVSGSNQLYNGLEQLNSKAPALKKGTSDLNSGAQTIAKAVNGLKTIYYDGIEAKGLPALVKVLDGFNSIAAAAQPLQPFDDISSSTFSSDISQLESIYSNLPDGQEKTDLGNVITDLKSVSSSISTDANKVQVNNQIINGFNGSITTLKTTAGAIPYEKAAMDEAFGKYEKGGKTGSATAEGAATLAKGMADLDANAGTLVKGVNDLDNGAEQISEGMEKLYKQGIKKIVDLYNNDLKGLTNGLDNVMDAGKGYKTFTKLPGNMDGNVKFIYKTTINK